MKVFNIYPISGLFYELYNPNVDHYSTEPLDFTSDNPLIRLNGLFWAKLFSKESLNHLIERMTSYPAEKMSNIEKAVIANPTLFQSLILEAPLNIVNHRISEQEMFAFMEQIEIACKLFSKYVYAPFVLSIQDGFQEPTLSSRELIECALEPNRNPYMNFLNKYVFPGIKILEEEPSLVWINGQPRISTIAIADKMKKLYPNAIIALRYHSSEYYSLNKIDELLVKNSCLFDILDCIVMDDSKNTCNCLEEAIQTGDHDLSQIKNLIIKTESGEIINTGYSKVVYSMEETMHIRNKSLENSQEYLDPHSVMNLKINPNTACYWNKCSFCAINKKYKYLKNEEQERIADKISRIHDYYNQGIRYLWFEDEALPPKVLNELAEAIILENIEIRWQVRSRIDADFSKDLAEKLYSAGLREIRFGLESASERILGLMNKFPEDVSLDLVERVVDYCTKCGIHVHFPMIVGFPTETVQERIDTYKYLLELKHKYKMVTFNINVLMLDIASDLFKNFHKYNISAVSFPCEPFEFLGNMVNFSCDGMGERRDSIDFKRNEFMRDALYPWMPKSAQIKPNIFYRLSETIRNTLIWHCYDDVHKNKKECTSVKIEEALSIWKDEGLIRVYNWKSHRLFEFTNDDFAIFEEMDNQDFNNAFCNPFGHALIDAGLLVGKNDAI